MQAPGPRGPRSSKIGLIERLASRRAIFDRAHPQAPERRRRCLLAGSRTPGRGRTDRRRRPRRDRPRRVGAAVAARQRLALQRRRHRRAHAAGRGRSSAIGVAGTVFSITIAALSLAAGQMGPRLLRNFTRDRGNQMTLGVFLGTFAYALMVLRSVRTPDEGDFVPHLALSVGILLAFACVATLVYFVGHMAGRINVDAVIELVTDDVRSAIRRLTSEEPHPEPPPEDVLARRQARHRFPARLSPAARQRRPRRLGGRARHRHPPAGAAGRLRVPRRAYRLAATAGGRRGGGHPRRHGARLAAGQLGRSGVCRAPACRGRRARASRRHQRSPHGHQRARSARRRAMRPGPAAPSDRCHRARRPPGSGRPRRRLSPA